MIKTNSRLTKSFIIMLSFITLLVLGAVMSNCGSPPPPAPEPTPEPVKETPPPPPVQPKEEPKADPNAIFAEGDKAWDAKEYAKAKDLYEQAIGLGGKQSRASARLGFIYYYKETTGVEKDETKALTHYNEAIEQDNRNDFAYAYRGDFYYQSGDKDKAYADADKALSINSNFNADVPFEIRGIIDFEKGNEQKSQKDLEKAVSLDGNNPVTLNYSSVLKAELNLDFATSLQRLNKAVELESNNAVLLVNRAFILAQQKQFTAAIKDLEKAKGINPDLPLLCYGFAYVNLISEPGVFTGDKKVALEFAIKANELTKYEDLSYLLILAEAYYQNGNKAKAEEFINKAKALAPDNKKVVTKAHFIKENIGASSKGSSAVTVEVKGDTEAKSKEPLGAASETPDNKEKIHSVVK